MVEVYNDEGILVAHFNYYAAGKIDIRLPYPNPNSLQEMQETAAGSIEKIGDALEKLPGNDEYYVSCASEVQWGTVGVRLVFGRSTDGTW